MEKRGQVTTFVVVGIVILIVLGGFLAYKFWFVKKDLDLQLNIHSKLPEEIKPVSQMLDSCTQDLLKNGVDMLGSSGGYIELPEEVFLTNLFIPLSSKLEVVNGFSVPVWFRERPTGEQVTNIPSKEEMEFQLENYVSENFYTCLELLSDFPNYNFVARKEEVKSKVNILDNIVEISVDFPIEINIRDINFLLSNQLARVEVPLGRLYENAVEILKKENENYFLERKTLDLLVAYDDEVPYSGIDLECYEKTWSKTKVVQRLKEILQSNVASIRISGTNYENVDDYFVVDALENPGSGLSVSFMYSPSWPTFVEVDPSKGDIMSGDSISRGTGGFLTKALSSFFCFSSHHFIYDIKYPVLVSLIDDKTGFNFNFVTQILIDNNQPRVNRFEPTLVNDVNNQVCEGANKYLEVRTGYSDGGSYKPLNDVDVSYRCYPAKCGLGKSVDGVAAGLVPTCVGGSVEAEKQGFYRGKSTGVSTNEELESVNVMLNKIYPKKVKILVIEKETGEVREPFDDEEISFEFVNSNGFVGRVSYPDDSVIDLVEGHYVVTSYVIGESTWPVTTPKQKVENCVDVAKAGFLGLIGQQEEKCFEVETESIELDFALKGGTRFEFDVDPSDLINGNEIVIYTMVSPVAGDLESLMAVSLASESGEEDPNFRYPVI